MEYTAMQSLCYDVMDECGVEADFILDFHESARVLGRTEVSFEDDGSVGMVIRVFSDTCIKIAEKRSLPVDYVVTRTMKHELAHYAHNESILPGLFVVCKEVRDQLPPNFPEHVITEHSWRKIRKGRHSSHGPVWKKFAVQLGADPRAKF